MMQLSQISRHSSVVTAAPRAQSSEVLLLDLNSIFLHQPVSIQYNSVKYTVYDILFTPCPSKDLAKAAVTLQ